MNHKATSGFSYAQSLRLASGAFGGKVDARPLPGNALQHGTYMSSLLTDIFGRQRATLPTIGAVENIPGSPMLTAAG